MSKRKTRATMIAPEPAVPLLRQRAGLLLAGAVLFLLVLFACVGPAWAAATYRLLTDGGVLLVWLAAMLGIGFTIARLPGLDAQNTGFATSAALGIGSTGVLVLLLGLAGLLNRPVAWGLIVLGVALLAWRLFRRRELDLSTALKPRVDASAYLGLVGVPFLAIAVFGALVLPGLLWGDEPHGYDVLEYHLQIPREWYEAGRIIPLHHNVFSYFPFNVEMHYLLAMYLRGGPWAGMYLAQLMHVAMMVLAVVATAEFARKLQPDSYGSLIGVWFAAATPWLTLLASVAYNEGGLMLFGTLAVGWAVCGARSEPSSGSRTATQSMILAGLMAGFACGVKFTAVPMLVGGIAVVYLGSVLCRRQFAQLKGLAMFLLCAALAFAPWLIRNWIWTRNPVFPEAMTLFGKAHFTVEQAERWRLAYVPPGPQNSIAGRLQAGWEQLLADWRFGFVLFPVAAIGLIRARRRHETVLIGAMLILWLLFWLFFTHLQSRFFVLAIPLLAWLIALGWAGPEDIVATNMRRWASTLLLLLQVALGLLGFCVTFASRLTANDPMQKLTLYQAALGADHYPVNEDLSDALAGGRPLCLIGDAQAFRYEIPMARLHYRTVFDVDARGGDAIAAWAKDCPPGCVRYINYDELQRFSRTYDGISQPAVKTGSALDKEIVP